MRFDGQSFAPWSIVAPRFQNPLWLSSTLKEGDGERSHKTAKHEQQPPHTDDDESMKSRRYDSG